MSSVSWALLLWRRLVFFWYLLTDHVASWPTPYTSWILQNGRGAASPPQRLSAKQVTRTLKIEFSNGSRKLASPGAGGAQVVTVVSTSPALTPRSGRSQYFETRPRPILCTLVFERDSLCAGFSSF